AASAGVLRDELGGGARREQGQAERDEQGQPDRAADLAGQLAHEGVDTGAEHVTEDEQVEEAAADRAVQARARLVRCRSHGVSVAPGAPARRTKRFRYAAVASAAVEPRRRAQRRARPPAVARRVVGEREVVPGTPVVRLLLDGGTARLERRVGRRAVDATARRAGQVV